MDARNECWGGCIMSGNFSLLRVPSLSQTHKKYQDKYDSLFGKFNNTDRAFHNGESLVVYSTWKDWEVGFIGDNFKDETDHIKVVFLDDHNKAKKELHRLQKNERDSFMRKPLTEAICENFSLHSRQQRRAFKNKFHKVMVKEHHQERETWFNFLDDYHCDLTETGEGFMLHGYLKRQILDLSNSHKGNARYAGLLFVLGYADQHKNFLDEKAIEGIKTHFQKWRILQPETSCISTFVVSESSLTYDRDLEEMEVGKSERIPVSLKEVV